MPRFSIIIPFYDGLENITEAVSSVLDQSYDDVEVIVVDDCDPDRSGNKLDRMFAADSRVSVLHRRQNGGTLRARREGVLASMGEYVLLLDQDDALVEGALDGISAVLDETPVDILHFGVDVIAETQSATAAREGMESFLRPPVRLLQGEEILTKQFAFDNRFDWHVHHKTYRGDFARDCWARAADENLALSDDLYLSFILASRAQSYRAVADAWYVYHLGRGETLAGNYDINKLMRVSRLDARALALLRDYVMAPENASMRGDWNERLVDVRDHLIEHVANEMADGLSLKERDKAITAIAVDWEPDALAGELWRFVRDRAYALFESRSYPDKNDDLYLLISQAREVDARVDGEGSVRYRLMHDAANRHLADLETIAPISRRVIRAFTRRLRG